METIGKEEDQKIFELYDSKDARIAYKYVMGGGGFDIHFGAFVKPTDTVYESAKETNRRLMTVLEWFRPITKESVVLDLGSGHGGLSHEVAMKYGCTVVGVNISPEQTKMNLEEAEKLGVQELIQVKVLNFNDGLPEEWTDKFTHIISCEVLCHATDKNAIFKEMYRVLQPGGALAFTDIMAADYDENAERRAADEEYIKYFMERNAMTNLARPSEYMNLMQSVGFKQASFGDLTCPHLEMSFQKMIDQIHKHIVDMIAEGASETYLSKWLESLTSRVEMQKKHQVFSWGFFGCRKDGPIY